MWVPLLLLVAGAYIVSRQRAGEPVIPTAMTQQNSAPFLSPNPSHAGSDGSGSTSPLGSWLSSFFATPGPYVPLSGPGGATASPAASGAPSGQSSSLLTPAAPGTTPLPSPIASDVASASDPNYWWMQTAIDVAIMHEDVSGAMQAAGNMDLTPAMLEASSGMVLP